MSTSPLNDEQREYVRRLVRDQMRDTLANLEAEGLITRHPPQPFDRAIEDLNRRARAELDTASASTATITREDIIERGRREAELPTIGLNHWVRSRSGSAPRRFHLSSGLAHIWGDPKPGRAWSYYVVARCGGYRSLTVHVEANETPDIGIRRWLEHQVDVPLNDRCARCEAIAVGFRKAVYPR